jgi:predicted Zn finger-like uncharacterized protein
MIDRTQCPTCQTVYRIVSDQLTMASGQVRCGACLHVFDAALHGWSTEAVMHATEATALDAIAPLLPAEPALAPNTPPLSADPESETDSSAAHPARQQSRSDKLDALRTYGRWWLLGAGIGAFILAIAWWITG